VFIGSIPAVRHAAVSQAYRPPQPLFTPERAEAASLRHWLEDDVQHAVLAVVHKRYSIKDGLHHVITAALALVEKARMDQKLARAVAVGAFNEALAEIEAHHQAVLQDMIAAAERELMRDGRDLLTAALAAAAIAERAAVPTDMIDNALRLARWRTRRRA
jgi:hypothetical protein